MKETRIPFFLISRHLLRSSKWTLLLIVFLMAIAFINMVFVTSLFNGIIESSDNQIIDTNTGHISIGPPEGEDYIGDAPSVLEKVKNTPGVKAASDRIMVPSAMKFKNQKLTFRVFVVDPDAERRVTIIDRKLTAGSYLKPDDTEGIVIGRQVAGGPGVDNISSFKGAEVGDKITLMFDRVQKQFTIRGIFDSNFIESDYQTFITKKALHEAAPYYDGKATGIIVRIGKKGDEQKVIKRLEENVPDLTLHPWQDMAGLMKSVTKSFTSIDVILSAVATLIAAVTIFIVIYIDINDKRSQIGILRAIGIKPYLIRAVYVLQSVVYSVLGVILGAGLFFAILVPYFKAHPFALPIGDAQLIVNYASFIGRAELIILVAIVSGLVPAIFVTRAPMLDEILGR